ncbi:MAG: 3'(2'),5'-bisphosphate nucleotidase CysQ [Pseudomonadota bacterium]|mgnify:CR=1 FL=1
MQAHDDLTLLINAARQAGDVALKFTGPDAQKWEKPDGAGPVTEADLAVDEALTGILRGARPDYGWLSEETDDDDARLSQDTVFIVDPIDGTRNFIEGGRTWAHSIAVAHKGQITAGVVYLPMRDMLYAAVLGTGATLNGDTLYASSQADLSKAELLSAKPNMRDQFWIGPVPSFARAYRPSLAYRCALVGQGRFDGMITFRPTWEWDIAAGALIASEAGARVSDRTGKALRFNQADPRTHGILAAAPKVHSALVAQHIPDA